MADLGARLVFPARLRQWGISSSIALTWLSNFAIAKITPIAILHIGYRWWIVSSSSRSNEPRGWRPFAWLHD